MLRRTPFSSKTVAVTVGCERTFWTTSPGLRLVLEDAEDLEVVEALVFDWVLVPLVIADFGGLPRFFFGGCSGDRGRVSTFMGGFWVQLTPREDMCLMKTP